MPDQKPTLEYGTAGPERRRRKILIGIAFLFLCLGIWAVVEVVSVVNSIDNFYFPPGRPTPIPATTPSTGPTSSPSGV